MERTIQPEDLKERASRRDLVLLVVRREPDYGADQEMPQGAKWGDPDKVDEWSAAVSGTGVA